MKLEKLTDTPHCQFHCFLCSVIVSQLGLGIPAVPLEDVEVIAVELAEATGA